MEFIFKNTPSSNTGGCCGVIQNSVNVCFVTGKTRAILMLSVLPSTNWK